MIKLLVSVGDLAIHIHADEGMRKITSSFLFRTRKLCVIDAISKQRSTDYNNTTLPECLKNS